MSNCFLCESSDIDLYPAARNPLNIQVKCPICGYYTITTLVVGSGLWEKESAKRHLLSALTRQASDAGSPMTITTENLYQLLDSVPKFDTPLENINLTLLLVMKKQSRADEYVNLDPNKDYPLVYVHDAAEFYHIIRTLFQQGFLEYDKSAGRQEEVRLTPQGWKQALELQKTQRISDQAFVAMSFAKELHEVWEKGIKPALESTGFKPCRVDQEEHNEKIDDRIIVGIRQSGLLVADFTGHRQGVYFEAGLAMGLGIPVIYTCKDTDIDTAHFDTRQYNHVVWTEPSELKSKLSLRISATIPSRKIT